MTWLAAKHLFKKTWLWLKHYWYIPAFLAYTFLMMVVFRRNGSATLSVLSTTKDSYKKQIETLNNSHGQEIEKRDKIIKNYNEIIEKLENEYKEEIRNLDKIKKKRIKQLVEQFHDNPEELSKLMSETFGIQYVK